MNFLKDILLQLFFLVVPLLIYYSLVHRRYSKPYGFTRQVAVFFYCASSAILCTLFPIQTYHDFTIYLSGIPVMMAFIYGGYLAGALTVLTLIMYTFIAPSSSWYVQVHSIIPALAALPKFFSESWKYFSNHPRNINLVVIAGLGGILHSISGFLLPLDVFVASGWSNHFLQGILFTITTLLLLYLIEFLCGIDQLQQSFKKMRKLHHINIMAEEASKEFQKPLTVVKGFTQLLGAETNKTNKEYVPIILHELSRAEKIFDSYLNLAKAEMFPAKTISSKELLDGVLARIYTYANNHNVQIKTKNSRNLRIKGNMDLLVESMTNILKHCIDSNPEEVKRIHLNHFLHRNDVVFEVLLNYKGPEQEPVKSLSQLPAMLENEENAALYTAYTVFLAHGGDICIKTRMFKQILVLTLPAQMKRREYASQKVIRTY